MSIQHLLPGEERVPNAIWKFNALVDSTAYWKDTGCEHHPACLSCPEVACIKEGRQQHYKGLAHRNEQIRALWKTQGGKAAVRALADRFGISPRRVYSICQV